MKNLKRFMAVLLTEKPITPFIYKNIEKEMEAIYVKENKIKRLNTSQR